MKRRKYSRLLPDEKPR